MKKFYLISLTVLSFGLTADLSPESLSQIESSVESMSLNELRDRRAYLMSEESQLLDSQSNTQNPSTIKSTESRLAQIRAELSAIQKALLAIVGAAAINAVTDDGYNDTIPPVITINGSNPVTVELGSVYNDDGASCPKTLPGIYAELSFQNSDKTYSRL